MKRIAVIGSGIAGLSSSYYLSRRHQVTLFESGDYIGGHTHTVEVEVDSEKSAIDTGFIVFNDRTYPNFMRLLDELQVPYQPTEMSFSVRNDERGLEYNGNNINSLFAQRKNLLNPPFWAMLADILRFNREVRSELIHPTNRTIGGYLDDHRCGSLFVDNYLLPMIAAIWSMNLRDARELPLQFFVRFFENHGLLQVLNRPQWYTINGGSRSYIAPMTERYRDAIRLNTPVVRVEPTAGGIRVVCHNYSERFDEAVIACHADQALKLLVDPSDAQRRVLGAFRFSSNDVILHTDESLMPKNKRAWASWNYLNAGSGGSATSLTYNMNILQRLQKKHSYLVSLNQDIAADKILGRFVYEHPVFNSATIQAQQQWHSVSGGNHVHFCGAYWFNGFHEDGVRSALRVCEALGVRP